MMVTGDYHGTAIAVARGVGMVPPDSQLIIIQSKEELQSAAQRLNASLLAAETTHNPQYTTHAVISSFSNPALLSQPGSREPSFSNNARRPISQDLSFTHTPGPHASGGFHKSASGKALGMFKSLSHSRRSRVHSTALPATDSVENPLSPSVPCGLSSFTALQQPAAMQLPVSSHDSSRSSSRRRSSALHLAAASDDLSTTSSQHQASALATPDSVPECKGMMRKSVQHSSLRLQPQQGSGQLQSQHGSIQLQSRQSSVELQFEPDSVELQPKPSRSQVHVVPDPIQLQPKQSSSQMHVLPDLQCMSCEGLVYMLQSEDRVEELEAHAALTSLAQVHSLLQSGVIFKTKKNPVAEKV